MSAILRHLITLIAEEHDSSSRLRQLQNSLTNDISLGKDCNTYSQEASWNEYKDGLVAVFEKFHLDRVSFTKREGPRKLNRQAFRAYLLEHRKGAINKHDLPMLMVLLWNLYKIVKFDMSGDW